MLLGEAIIVFIIAILQFIPPTKILAAKTIEITAKGLAFVGIFMVFRGIYELFIIWYSGVFYEQFAFYARGGLLASIVALTVGIILSQTLWIKKIRRNPFWIAIIALVIITANFI
ncbi:MAG: hypothetical protein GC192_04325 [Bacteroidetes bacterium]|nr:hypothetical protein [Bacteroidota bacterium]